MGFVYNILMKLLMLLIVLSTFDVSAERRKEYLESFPLEDLKVVGMVYFDNKQMALIHADGLLHRLEKGYYIGKNHGVIIELLKDKIILEESYFLGGKAVLKKKELIFEQPNKSNTDNGKDLSKYKGKNISFSINNVTVNEVILSLINLVDKNVIIASSIDQSTDFHVENVPWGFAFERVLKKNDLKSIDKCGFSLITTTKEFESVANALSKIPENCLPGDNMTLTFSRIDLPSMYSLLGDFQELSVEIDPKINEQFTIRAFNKSWHLIATLIAYLNNLNIEINKDKLTLGL